MKIDKKHVQELADNAHLKFKNWIMGTTLGGLTNFEKEIYKAGYEDGAKEAFADLRKKVVDFLQRADLDYYTEIVPIDQYGSKTELISNFFEDLEKAINGERDAESDD